MSVTVCVVLSCRGRGLVIDPSLDRRALINVQIPNKIFVLSILFLNRNGPEDQIRDN